MQTSPRTRQRLLGIFVAALLALNYPILSAVDAAADDGGNALVVFWLYGVWLLLIAAIAAMSRADDGS